MSKMRFISLSKYVYFVENHFIENMIKNHFIQSKKMIESKKLIIL
jgi:hypothetical protein